MGVPSRTGYTTNKQPDSVKTQMYVIENIFVIFLFPAFFHLLSTVHLPHFLISHSHFGSYEPQVPQVCWGCSSGDATWWGCYAS